MSEPIRFRERREKGAGKKLSVELALSLKAPVAAATQVDVRCSVLDCRHRRLAQLRMSTATRRREWLLDIDFRKRETFAHACETYNRILELGDTPAARTALLNDARGR